MASLVQRPPEYRIPWVGSRCRAIWFPSWCRQYSISLFHLHQPCSVLPCSVSSRQELPQPHCLCLLFRAAQRHLYAPPLFFRQDPRSSAHSTTYLLLWPACPLLPTFW